jgi:hypothetical protein
MWAQTLLPLRTWLRRGGARAAAATQQRGRGGTRAAPARRSTGAGRNDEVELGCGPLRRRSVTVRYGDAWPRAATATRSTGYTDDKTELDAEPASAVAPASAHERLPRLRLFFLTQPRLRPSPHRNGSSVRARP